MRTFKVTQATDESFTQSTVEADQFYLPEDCTNGVMFETLKPGESNKDVAFFSHVWSVTEVKENSSND